MSSGEFISSPYVSKCGIAGPRGSLCLLSSFFSTKKEQASGVEPLPYRVLLECNNVGV